MISKNEGNAVPPPLSLALGLQIGAVISETENKVTDIPLLPPPTETQIDIKTENRKRKRNPSSSGRVSLAKKRKNAN